MSITRKLVETAGRFKATRASPKKKTPGCQGQNNSAQLHSPIVALLRLLPTARLHRTITTRKPYYHTQLSSVVLVLQSTHTPEQYHTLSTPLPDVPLCTSWELPSGQFVLDNSVATRVFVLPYLPFRALTSLARSGRAIATSCLPHNQHTGSSRALEHGISFQSTHQA